MSEGEDENVDGIVDEKMHLVSLRDRVLDRLAEVLSRFKTDRTRRKGAFLDPKHVSAAFMVIHDHCSRVDIYCVKNEGLNQRNGNGSKDNTDTDFLETWSRYMRCISKRGACLAVAL